MPFRNCRTLPTFAEDCQPRWTQPQFQMLCAEHHFCGQPFVDVHRINSDTWKIDYTVAIGFPTFPKSCSKLPNNFFLTEQNSKLKHRESDDRLRLNKDCVTLRNDCATLRYFWFLGEQFAQNKKIPDTPRRDAECRGYAVTALTKVKDSSFDSFTSRQPHPTPSKQHCHR